MLLLLLYVFPKSKAVLCRIRARSPWTGCWGPCSTTTGSVRRLVKCAPPRLSRVLVWEVDPVRHPEIMMIIAAPFRAARFRREIGGHTGVLPARHIDFTGLTCTHTYVCTESRAHRRNVSSISVSVVWSGAGGRREMDETVGPAAKPRVTYLQCLWVVCISDCSERRGALHTAARREMPESLGLPLSPHSPPVWQHYNARVFSRCLTIRTHGGVSVTLQRYIINE